MSNQTTTILVTFAITPTKLITNLGKAYSTHKTFIFKFGSSQCRSLGVNLPTQITIKTTYCHKTQQYYPIKGIIKIFQVDDDGNQILAAVGASNIDNLPKQNGQTIKLKFNVGQNVLQTDITIIQFKSQENCFEQSKTQRNSFTNTYHSKAINKSETNPFNKEKRILEQDCQQIPYIFDDSDDKIDKLEQISASYYSQFSEDIKQDERNYLGQQLIEQRRKLRVIQQKLQKSTSKNINLKQIVQAKKAQIRSFIHNFKKFTNSLESDHKGQYVFSLNQKNRQISIKFKAANNFVKNFEQFLNFMAKKIQERESTGSSERIGQNQYLQISSQSYNDQDNSQRIKKLNQQKTQLKTDLLEKNKQLQQKDITIHKLNNKLKRIQEDFKSSQGMNQYLQEKDKQMENIINIKENTIQNLKKMIDDNNIDMDVLEEKINGLHNTINNLELHLQQNKEQIYNLNETIEGYRKKYGDLKVIKNKAIDTQFKQCLRWIDQQANKQSQIDIDNQLNFQDQTSDDMANFSSLIKKIDLIETLSLDQISSIRKQVVIILKKIDDRLLK